MSEVKQQHEQQGQPEQPHSPLGDQELRAWWLATTEQLQHDTFHTAPGNTPQYERDASGLSLADSATPVLWVQGHGKRGSKKLDYGSIL
ncbi:hypothetical protein SpCBS45565_g06552 [Spizellomyces sp. 'palustris']|nr:hypothetical protein SpCBS45565_g06552 [Spizellomyces sp. 'palustris']